MNFYNNYLKDIEVNINSYLLITICKLKIIMENKGNIFYWRVTMCHFDIFRIYLLEERLSSGGISFDMKTHL